MITVDLQREFLFREEGIRTQMLRHPLLVLGAYFFVLQSRFDRIPLNGDVSLSEFGNDFIYDAGGIHIERPEICLRGRGPECNQAEGGRVGRSVTTDG